MKPIIRDLEDGSVVVDYGNKWFRCQLDGQVITKIAKNGRVECRPATSIERMTALADAAFGPIGDK